MVLVFFLVPSLSLILACWYDWVLIALSYDCIDLFVLWMIIIVCFIYA